MPDPNPFDDELNKIEIGIRQLKLQYDMFFAGVVPRQPHEVRKGLEILIKVIGNSPMQRFADRYRYNSLAAKYQTMVELWNKMLRAKEEGRLRPGIPGFVEPVRRAPLDPTSPTAPTAPAEEATGSRAAGAKRRPAATAEFYRSSFTNPAAEDESFRVFYDRYMEANRMAAGEGVKRVTYKSFLKQITAKTHSIKQKAGCDSVTYSIVVKDGSVSLKAVPAGQAKQKGGGR